MSWCLCVDATQLRAKKMRLHVEPRRDNNLFPLFKIVPQAQCFDNYCTTDMQELVNAVVEGQTNVSDAFPMNVSSENFKRQEGDRFSMMKYGHNVHLDFYAGLMSRLIIEKFPALKTAPERFVLVRPASIQLPTAATILESKILNLLNKECGGGLRDLAMVRSGHTKVDFAKLNTKEERDKALEGLFTLEGPPLSGQ